MNIKATARIVTCPYLRRIDLQVGPDLRHCCELLQREVRELSIE